MDWKAAASCRPSTVANFSTTSRRSLVVACCIYATARASVPGVNVVKGLRARARVQEEADRKGRRGDSEAKARCHGTLNFPPWLLTVAQTAWRSSDLTPNIFICTYFFLSSFSMANAAPYNYLRSSWNLSISLMEKSSLLAGGKIFLCFPVRCF